MPIEWKQLNVYKCEKMEYDNILSKRYTQQEI